MELYDVLAAFIVVVGLILIVTGLRGRHPSLSERLAPYQPKSVADEAQEWLQEQSS